VARFKKLYKLKLKQFFSNCKSKDFKNSKKFWKFYSNVVKVKSVKKLMIFHLGSQMGYQ